MGEEHSKAPAPFRKPAAFLLSAPEPQFFPKHDVPEIAVIGRSNVGKSSLINALLGAKGVARTSKTPGRTRELNFFNIGGTPPLFCLVDMPGYGFAKISKTEQAKWRSLCEAYLNKRANLRRVLLLIDSRHEFKDVDVQMLDALTAWRVPVTIVLTKTDQSKKKMHDWHGEHFKELQRTHVTLIAPMHKTTSFKRLGLYNLQEELIKVVTA